MKKNKKALTPDEVDNLKNKKKSLNLLLEQMRVTGIRSNENEYLNELKNINLLK